MKDFFKYRVENRNYSSKSAAFNPCLFDPTSPIGVVISYKGKSWREENPLISMM